MTEREQVVKYFSIFNGKRPLYSELKPQRHTIDLLIKQGDLAGQTRMDGEIEIFRIDKTPREPVDIDIR